ncbi:MAG: carbohydrate ABC transporter permease [Clostridia bacterium]|nr:carbohydrate ABC transporter permease [Clostridia bacterium]
MKKKQNKSFHINKFSDKTYGIITALDFKKGDVKLIYGIAVAFIVIVSLICIVPIIWLFVSCLKGMDEFLAIPPTFFPKELHPEKIAEVWKELNFGKYFLNTAVMIVGSLIGTIFLNGIAGYALSRLKPLGSSVLFALIMWTMMMPQTLNLVPLFKNFLNYTVFHFNLTNTHWPMWIISVANCMNILMFKNFFDTIPLSYVESAKLDGASDLGVFTKIIVPLSRPIIAVIALRVAVANWDMFLWPYLMLKDPDKYTVSVMLYYMKTTFGIDKQIMAAFFAIIPPAVIFVLFQKQIVHNDNNAGVKG